MDPQPEPRERGRNVWKWVAVAIVVGMVASVVGYFIYLGTSKSGLESLTCDGDDGCTISSEITPIPKFENSEVETMVGEDEDDEFEDPALFDEPVDAPEAVPVAGGECRGNPAEGGGCNPAASSSASGTGGEATANNTRMPASLNAGEGNGPMNGGTSSSANPAAAPPNQKPAPLKLPRNVPAAPEPAQGPAQGAARAPAQGAAQGAGQGPPQGPAQGAAQGPPRRPPQGPAQGAAQGPPQGPAQGAAQGPARAPAQGAAQGAGQGPPRRPPQGPAQGAAQGPPQGPAQGAAQGPARAPAQGAAQGAGQGAARAPAQGAANARRAAAASRLQGTVVNGTDMDEVERKREVMRALRIKEGNLSFKNELHAIDQSGLGLKGAYTLSQMGRAALYLETIKNRDLLNEVKECKKQYLINLATIDDFEFSNPLHMEPTNKDKINECRNPLEMHDYFHAFRKALPKHRELNIAFQQVTKGCISIDVEKLSEKDEAYAYVSTSAKFRYAYITKPGARFCSFIYNDETVVRLIDNSFHATALAFEDVLRGHILTVEAIKDDEYHIIQMFLDKDREFYVLNDNYPDFIDYVDRQRYIGRNP